LCYSYKFIRLNILIFAFILCRIYFKEYLSIFIISKATLFSHQLNSQLMQELLQIQDQVKFNVSSQVQVANDIYVQYKILVMVHILFSMFQMNQVLIFLTLRMKTCLCLAAHLELKPYQVVIPEE
jgi:hypothetical protein